MDTDNMMRVNARSGSFAGHGNSPNDKQQHSRQKVQALLEAISSGDLENSRHAFQALVNFDVATLADPQFLRISKFLDASSIYLAQQVVKEIKASLLNAQPLRSTPKPQIAQFPALRLDGLHLVDLRA
jgi:hypothetical protein